ncbi:flagellar filament capping protein FliD [Sulfurimonas sp.]|uniref:flagellar filament capping protein FliD n=1 Tax=Sulfurimonas sp. TaxID=2022749 RepID=UPI0025CCC4D4|nr:flagellar filament capping protein FliD [Sulfurimonas sp.]MDD5157990.1 flagellar filament capping protein FliD [Sulfurimonas sp.]
MSGTINSLGIGSGVLTADVIDKLRANDEANIIKPIDDKITLNTQKTQASTLLTSLVSSFKTSVSALDNDTLYQKRTVTGSNDGVSVSALSGSQIHDFSLEVTSIAKKSVLKSGDFASTTTNIASGDGTLNLNIAGTNYKVDYTSSTTLGDLKDKINDIAGSKIGASILQTSANTYNLVLTSKDTGKDQTISLSDLSGNLTGGLLEMPSVSTGSFTSASSTLASGGTAGDTIISVDGVSYNFAYSASKTLQQLADDINNHATLGTKVSASIVQNGTNDYKMVLTPKAGVSSSITISDSAINAGLTSSIKTTAAAANGPVTTGLFSGASATIASAATSGNTDINVNGVVYSFAYDDTTTLQGLTDSINNDVAGLGAMVTASIVPDGTSFRMVLAPKVALTAPITIADSSAGLAAELTTTVPEPGSVETGSFAGVNTAIAGSGTYGFMKININGTDYSIGYNDTTTLQQLTDNINADTTLKNLVTASIIDDGAGGFRMQLVPKVTTGPITIGDIVPQITSTTTSTGGMSVIQDAKDASFKYDGIAMTRSKNTITDIATGLTVNLLKDGGSANISITQNRDQISTEIKGLVTSYNTLIKQLADMTGSNSEAKTAGIFNGNNSIRGIGREITNFITSTDSKGRSFLQYGIDIDKDGVMTFDDSKFLEKMNAAPDDTEAFFSGKTTITSAEKTVTGAFAGTSSLISDGINGGTMNINIGDTGYSLAYSATTTLQQMVDSINANTSLNTKVTASVVKYNTSDYRMVLTPKDSTIGELFTITDSVGGGLLSNIKSTSFSPETSTTDNGLFTFLNDLLKGYTNTNGVIDSLNTSTKNSAASLTAERSKNMKSLDARYEAMKVKFASYDLLINQANSNFSSLKMIIDTSTATSK